MKKIRIVLMLILVFPLCLRSQSAKPATIIQINLDVVVHPVSADYVRSGITHAKDIGARAVIIRINTPGGLLDSMRDMVGAILDSDVPVITWVGPNGSRAASAGFFVLLAGDVAAMAPGTNTGAAHPVTGSGGKIEDVMEKKVVSDITAYIRSYVSKRGRNTALAELGVVESRAFTAQEAVDQKLIDGLANDVPDLIRKYQRTTDTAIQWQHNPSGFRWSIRRDLCDVGAPEPAIPCSGPQSCPYSRFDRCVGTVL